MAQRPEDPHFLSPFAADSMSARVREPSVNPAFSSSLEKTSAPAQFLGYSLALLLVAAFCRIPHTSVSP